MFKKKIKEKQKYILQGFIFSNEVFYEISRVFIHDEWWINIKKIIVENNGKSTIPKGVKKKRKKHDVDGNVNITRDNWCLGEKKINKLLLLAINSTS